MKTFLKKRYHSAYKKIKPSHKTLKHILLGAGVIFFLLIIFSVISVVVIYKNLPQPEDIFAHQVNQSTKLYNRDGTILLYEIHGEEKRTVVSYEEIPDFIKQATISIEDQGFYNHPAFDWRAIIRSLIKNAIYLRIEQGGSTITQQLAKNAYLSPEKTISRKIKELLLAMRLEQQFTKDEILNLYLNQIPYGSNAYGIEAASNTFFNKKAKDLNLAEAALLVALPNAPSYYSPYGSHKEELTSRKNFILNEMKKLGYIDDQQLSFALKYKFSFAPQATSMKAPHFVVAVQDYLVKKYGYDIVEKGGLRVITTLDWRLQQAAESIVFKGVTRNTELYKGKNGALFAEDPKTGEVLAVVGSKDYFDIANEGNFNVAMQGLRQPGSAFKPFAYYTAFKKGYTPETVLFDVPTEFDTTKIPANSYKPEDYGNIYRGPINLRNALARSLNVPAVKIMYLAGMDNVIQTAKDFGINTLTERSRYGLSLVLGGGEVKLSELVHAYTVFANNGIQSAQTLVLEVKNDKGEVLESYQNTPKQVGDSQYSRMINDILSDTDARAQLFGSVVNSTIFPNQPVALKTGTTNNYVDAWSVGYTPGIVFGLWIGNNHREPLQKNGGSIVGVIPMWSEFMKVALDGKDPEPFIKPDPYSTNKPILKGDYLNNKQVHSILYYIDKDNPQGPIPEDPEKDPQFWNWEMPVLNWAKQNIPDFNSYNKGVRTTGDNSDIKIVINSPQNGAFVSEQLSLNFGITSTFHNINSVEILWNDTQIDKFNAGPMPLSYQKTITVPKLELQNKLSIKAIDDRGASFQKDIIVFE